MKSYFFIPASKQKFLNKVGEIPADHLVFDLEDSIAIDEIDEAILSLSAIKGRISNRDFIRIPWYIGNPERTFSIIGKLRESGFYNYFLPKIESLNELHLLYKSYPDIFSAKIILLIENPKLLLNLQEVLNSYSFSALAFGSHDYAAFMNMKHNEKNLLWPRQYILNFAKAQLIESLDIAPMNINDEDSLILEYQAAYELGYEGKMLIHPFQLEVLNKMTYFSQEDIEIALELEKYIDSIGGKENFIIHRIADKVIERPHLNKYLSILKSLK